MHHSEPPLQTLREIGLARSRWFAMLLAVVAVLLLPGCATYSPKVALQPGTLVPGQTITLVRVPEVKIYKLHAMHPAMVLGMVGRLAALAHMESRAEELRLMMIGQKVAAHEVLADVLARDLEGAGFKVRQHSVSWTENEWGAPEPDLSKLPPSHQRVLVVAPALVGFWSQGLNGNYQPAVRVRATLYGTDRSQPLYDAHHATGLALEAGDWVDVPPGGAGYTDFSALTAQPSATAALLKYSIALVARSVVRDLTGAGQTASGKPRPPLKN